MSVLYTAAAILGYTAAVFALCLIHPVLGVAGIGALGFLGSAGDSQ